MMTFTTYNLLSRKPWKDFDQIIVAHVIYENCNFYCGCDCSESTSNARSFPMHVFVCLCCWSAGERGKKPPRARLAWAGVVWPGLDGEGQPWLSCLKWLLCHLSLALKLYERFELLSLALRQGIGLGVRRAGELPEALCRDKSLLASVAVLPSGSNKVQQSPCTSTKQKMENVGRKSPVLGSAHFPPSWAGSVVSRINFIESQMAWVGRGRKDRLIPTILVDTSHSTRLLKVFFNLALSTTRDGASPPSQ